MARKEVEWSVSSIMKFDTDELFKEVVDSLCSGFSVVVDAVAYMGNGRYERRNKKARYRFKMITPIADKCGLLYSTDLFEGGAENAIKGHYGIYRATRQLVVGVVAKVETDYNIERFGFGYKDGSYGIYKVSL